VEPTRLPDPFGIQSDPRLYVPRRATEAALDELERAALSPRHAVVLFTGPPGIGKTLLLHVLAGELAPRLRTAYLPYARLSAGGLWAWAAKELGLEVADEPRRALRRLLGELAGEGRGLLLAIDDASSLPDDAVADLIAFSRVEPALRVVLAFSEGERLAGPVPEDAPVVRLDEPMSRLETQDYVKGRLARWGAPRGVAERFDAATVAQLHRESEGIPLRLHGVADAVLRAADPVFPAPAVESAPDAEPPVASAAAPAEPVRPGDPASAVGPGTPPERAALPEPPPDARPPGPPRRRGRSRRRSRRALGRVAWAAAGLCAGLAAGLVVAPRADRLGLATPTGRDARGPLTLEPAPAASPADPARAPARDVAGAPPPPEPAPAQAPAAGGEPAAAGAPPAAGTREQASGVVAGAPPSPPTDGTAARPLADPGGVPAPEAEPSPLADAGAPPPADASAAPPAAGVGAAPAPVAAPTPPPEPSAAPPAPAVGAPPPSVAAPTPPPEASAPPPPASVGAAPPADASASPAAEPGVAPAPDAAAPPPPAATPAPPAAAATAPAPAPGEAAPPDAPAARPAPLAAGQLAVFAEDDVEIEIDGRRFGAPPLAGLRLRRGPHRVVAHYRDGRVGQKTVVLGDEDVSVTFR
jgi:type II secretory pathway predicted ATPase ExeA